MKDFPVFTTEYGAASLVLKEIPYRETAYIILRDSLEPEKLLEECVSFCRACGAERIYAAGHACLEKYPLYTSVLEMRGEVRVEEEKIENLWPVTQETVSKWRELLNERMKDVDNAATLEQRDEKRILQSGGAYFIHRRGELLGLGWLDGEKLLAIASIQSGAGERVARTLLSVAEDQAVTLEVASTNERAIKLYEKLGFIKVMEISRWYRV